MRQSHVIHAERSIVLWEEDATFDVSSHHSQLGTVLKEAVLLQQSLRMIMREHLLISTSQNGRNASVRVQQINCRVALLKNKPLGLVSTHSFADCVVFKESFYK
jgi:Lhr-like helicase